MRKARGGDGPVRAPDETPWGRNPPERNSSLRVAPSPAQEGLLSRRSRSPATYKLPLLGRLSSFCKTKHKRKLGRKKVTSESTGPPYTSEEIYSNVLKMAKVKYF